MDRTESDILARTFELVRERLVPLHDPAHGWEHVQRVYELALKIAEHERADALVVGMAALLHDIGRATQDELPGGKGHHANRSVDVATELLRGYHIREERSQAILHAIVAHSFSLGVQPATLEASVVRDADRLDALGALGITRWAITGAQRCTTETRLYHPDDPFADQRPPDDRYYMLDHFYQKLLLLEETLVTETARQMARPRVEFMRVFLAELRAELCD